MHNFAGRVRERISRELLTSPIYDFHYTVATVHSFAPIELINSKSYFFKVSVSKSTWKNLKAVKVYGIFEKVILSFIEMCRNIQGVSFQKKSIINYWYSFEIRNNWQEVSYSKMHIF